MADIYQLSGRILRSDRLDRNKNLLLIQREGEQYRVICSFFCPARTGDLFLGAVKRSGEELICVAPPLVQIPVDRPSVEKSFYAALSGKRFDARRLYDKLKSFSLMMPATKVADEKERLTLVGEDGVVDYLCQHSVAYVRTRTSGVVGAISREAKMGPEHTTRLLRWWYRSVVLRRLYLFGMTNAEIASHLDPNQIYRHCLTNPFRLVTISLEKACTISRMLGKEPSAVEMRCGEIVRCVHGFNRGLSWTCVPLSYLVYKHPTFHQFRGQLEKNYDMVVDDQWVYLEYPHRVEEEVAAYLDRLIKRTWEANKEDKAKPPPMFFDGDLIPEQREAVMGALRHHISIIRGGAGTGKSTVIREIVNNLKKRGIKVAVTSFTGKAVARLHEILEERNGATMDRMIAVALVNSASGEEISDFQHLIIDESSMVTTELFYRFFRRFPGKYSITFVGDTAQLPPISWGMLYHELIASGRVPIYTLTKNHRTQPLPGSKDRENLVLFNANRLVDPQRDLSIPFEFACGDSFSVEEGGIEEIRKLLLRLREEGKDYNEITALCPYSSEKIGCLRHLNRLFQEIFFADQECHFDSLKRPWFIGERAMMINNNYQEDLFNGDEGVITAFDKKGITVRFRDDLERVFLQEEEDPSREKGNLSLPEDEEFARKELNIRDLVPSSAKTIHKSQGSEYRYVICYFSDVRREISEEKKRKNRFLTIDLLNTAITRTRDICWIVGSLAVLLEMAATLRANRCERLQYRLRDLHDPKLEPPMVKEEKPVASGEPEDESLPSHDDFDYDE